MEKYTERLSPMTGLPYPRCLRIHDGEQCDKAVYSKSLCYRHFQDMEFASDKVAGPERTPAPRHPLVTSSGSETSHSRDEAHEQRNSRYSTSAGVLCAIHGDRRDHGNEADAVCTCYQGPAECPVCHKRHAADHPHRNERVCIICKKPKNKRTAFRDHVSSICADCTAIAEADEDARWNAKTPEQHAADGAALFARMEARR
jgi:hypothetical protein